MPVNSAHKSETFWADIRRESLTLHPLPQLISSVKLPALPGVVEDFLDVSEDPCASIQQLAATLESDSGITCELLRHVNSASFASDRRAGTVAQAINLLGLRMAKTFVMTIGIQAAMASTKTRVMNQTTFWNESLQRGLFAKECARAGGIDGDVAFLGALLQDFLLPVLASEYPEEYFHYLTEGRKRHIDLCEYERRVLHCDHATAAAHLAHSWNLPDDLVCCIFFHHQIPLLARHSQLGDSACLPVAVSSLLHGQLQQVPGGESRLIELDRMTDTFDLVNVCETVDERLQAMAHGNCVQFPLTRRIKARIPQNCKQ
ncbi:MAG: HDOD domain-containing protein [Planctomycetaceae bacterium]|nr:HDOD domain-containing protein [Planctomycetaceae bacterium]